MQNSFLDSSSVNKERKKSEKGLNELSENIMLKKNEIMCNLSDNRSQHPPFCILKVYYCEQGESHYIPTTFLNYFNL